MNRGIKIGQIEVMELLGKHKGKRFTNKVIAKRLGVPVGQVTAATKRLRSKDMIKFEYCKHGLYRKYIYWVE